MMKPPKFLNPRLQPPTRIYLLPPLLYRPHNHSCRRGELTVCFPSLLSRLHIHPGTIPSCSASRWIQNFYPIRLQVELQSQRWPQLVCQTNEICSQTHHSRSISHLCSFKALLCPNACLLVRYRSG